MSIWPGRNDNHGGGGRETYRRILQLIAILYDPESCRICRILQIEAIRIGRRRSGRCRTHKVRMYPVQIQATPCIRRADPKRLVREKSIVRRWSRNRAWTIIRLSRVLQPIPIIVRTWQAAILYRESDQGIMNFRLPSALLLYLAQLDSRNQRPQNCSEQEPDNCNHERELDEAEALTPSTPDGSGHCPNGHGKSSPRSKILIWSLNLLVVPSSYCRAATIASVGF